MGGVSLPRLMRAQDPIPMSALGKYGGKDRISSQPSAGG